ncbi:hypothetical protein [Yinghuangia soli]|uniref:Uncharacterized protein n=1 Tax=Yinghuangia soli TaxID=2908204 RepID=A0AA41U335_9ACTN|nr:hypothetical protein [Yinghuangia soli]MCF2531390.1 hypothetical protein [Yinghuangia soli]
MSQPYRRPPRSRSGTETAAGVLGFTYGLIIGGAGAAGMMWGISDFGEVGWLALLCPFVIALGVAMLRNGWWLLKGDGDGERLAQLLFVPAGLSGVAIGSIIAQGDLSTDSIQKQLTGFIAAFVLSVIGIVMASRA